MFLCKVGSQAAVENRSEMQSGISLEASHDKEIVGLCGCSGTGLILNHDGGILFRAKTRAESFNS